MRKDANCMKPRGRFWAWECLQWIVLAPRDVQEAIGSFGMAWITLYMRKWITTFCPISEFSFSLLTAATLVLLPCFCSLYVLWCIRVTKTTWILWNYGDWMWFYCHMIYFHNHPNYAIFASNYLDSFWSDLAIIIRFDFHQNQIFKTIFGIFCYLFDLMWFLINKNHNKINKWSK